MQKHVFIGSICIPENKRVVFGHIDKFGKDMEDKLRKTHAKTLIYRVYFHT